MPVDHLSVDIDTAFGMCASWRADAPPPHLQHNEEMILAGVGATEDEDLAVDLTSPPTIPRRLRRANKRPNLEQHKRDLRRRTMQYDTGRQNLLEELKHGNRWSQQLEEEVWSVVKPLYRHWKQPTQINEASTRKNARTSKPGKEGR